MARYAGGRTARTRAGKVTVADILTPLRRAVAQGDDAAAEAAVQALLQDPQAALTPLLQLAQAEDPDLRWWAVRALAEIRDPRVPPRLHAALHDPDPAVRQAAALGLRLHRAEAGDAFAMAARDGRDEGVSARGEDEAVEGEVRPVSERHHSRVEIEALGREAEAQLDSFLLVPALGVEGELILGDLACEPPCEVEAIVGQLPFTGEQDDLRLGCCFSGGFGSRDPGDSGADDDDAARRGAGELSRARLRPGLEAVSRGTTDRTSFWGLGPHVDVVAVETSPRPDGRRSHLDLLLVKLEHLSARAADGTLRRRLRTAIDEPTDPAAPGFLTISHDVSSQSRRWYNATGLGRKGHERGAIRDFALMAR